MSNFSLGRSSHTAPQRYTLYAMVDRAHKLARLRELSGRRQEELAEAAGLSRATYQRLESGRMPNPPLRYLVNLSIVLECELGDLIEDEWREWMPLNGIKSPPHQS